MNFSPEINEVIYILLLMCVALLKTKYVVIKINQKKKIKATKKKCIEPKRNIINTCSCAFLQEINWSGGERTDLQPSILLPGYLKQTLQLNDSLFASIV